MEWSFNEKPKYIKQKQKFKFQNELFYDLITKMLEFEESQRFSFYDIQNYIQENYDWFICVFFSNSKGLSLKE